MRCLSRTHGGFKGGEAVIEGAENGNHTVGDVLALLQRFSHERRPLTQGFHGLDPHFWALLFLAVLLLFSV